ncbi:hypothetical protein F4825DRAFT_458226 [Nemania diffusa]|nr:hypothetical protein F4825DRAFT_458226 [Nemania diffusa]
MHESWACIANFGRFVAVGKRELVDAGKLDQRGFEVDNGTMQDPRAGLLSAALLAEHDKGQGVATGKPIDAATGIIAAPWYKSVSRKIVGMFA